MTEMVKGQAAGRVQQVESQAIAARFEDYLKRQVKQENRPLQGQATLKAVEDDIVAEGVIDEAWQPYLAKRQKTKVLKQAMVGILAICIMAASAVGYWLNIAISQETSQGGKHSGKKSADAQLLAKGLFFNTIQQPVEENAVYNLLGIESKSPQETQKAIEAAMDLGGVELANGADPFEPVLSGPPASSSSTGGGGGTASSGGMDELKETLQVQFSGLIDDPKTKKKVAILRVQNPNFANNGGPEYITVIKRAGERFTVGDRTVVLRSISGKQVNISIDGEPMTVTMNSFRAANAASNANRSTSGATAGNSSSTPPPAMDSEAKTNSITPANGGRKPVLKLEE